MLELRWPLQKTGWILRLKLFSVTCFPFLSRWSIHLHGMTWTCDLAISKATSYQVRRSRVMTFLCCILRSAEELAVWWNRVVFIWTLVWQQQKFSPKIHHLKIVQVSSPVYHEKIHIPQQHCSIKLSTMKKMFYVCTVQCGSHKPQWPLRLRSWSLILLIFKLLLVAMCVLWILYWTAQLWKGCRRDMSNCFMCSFKSMETMSSVGF